MTDDAPSADGKAVRLSVREHRGAILEAVRRLGEAGVAIDDLALRRPTLDDVFLTLTGHAAEKSREEAERAA
jgi:ABC-2 type transport system ATP-binding protein